MILAALVALEMVRQFSFATARFATGKDIRTVDRVSVTTSSAVIAQNTEAAAPHTTRLADEFPLRTTATVGNFALIALLSRARGGGLNVTKHRWWQGDETTL